MTADFKQGASLLGGILFVGQLGTANTTAYTVPANTGIKVATCACVNVSGAAANLTLWLQPAAVSTADATNRLISAYPVTAGSTVILDAVVGAFLGAGDKIIAVSSVASALDLTITGVLSS